MVIRGINNIEQLQNVTQTAKTEENSGSFTSFKEIFTDAVENINKTDLTAQQDIMKVATGEVDNLHSVTINTAKAELAVQMLVQVRNKALDAYNEIMRISL